VDQLRRELVHRYRAMATSLGHGVKAAIDEEFVKPCFPYISRCRCATNKSVASTARSQWCYCQPSCRAKFWLSTRTHVMTMRPMRVRPS
jgi:hypothetical protein